MSDNRLTIVTGASSNHFRCLKNLLYSISFFEPDARTVAYDLGLTAAEAAQLHENNVTVRKFDFSQYPPYVDIQTDAGQYAWKPIIVADALREFGGFVLWLDAGDLIHSRLTRMRGVLSNAGVYCPVSSGTVRRWTHPATLSYLGVGAELLDHPHLNAAIVGFLSGTPGVDELAERWKACALDRDCIAPFGSDRTNHRQDQAVLTILIHQFQRQYGVQLELGLLDVTTHNDELIHRKGRNRAVSWWSWPSRLRRACT